MAEAVPECREDSSKFIREYLPNLEKYKTVIEKKYSKVLKLLGIEL